MDQWWCGERRGREQRLDGVGRWETAVTPASFKEGKQEPVRGEPVPPLAAVGGAVYVWWGEAWQGALRACADGKHLGSEPRTPSPHPSPDVQDHAQ